MSNPNKDQGRILTELDEGLNTECGRWEEAFTLWTENGQIFVLGSELGIIGEAG